MGFGDRTVNRAFIQRFDRAQIDYFHANTFFFQLLRDRQRERNGLRITDDGNVGPFAFGFGFAERDKQFHFRRLNHSFRAVEQLRFKDEHWIIITDGCLQKPFRVPRGRGRAHLQTRCVGIQTFCCMRMGCTELMSWTIWSAKRDRNVELTAGHGEHVRGVVHNLIECNERKTERHELDDRPEPDHGRADTQPGETIFADRRVNDSRGTKSFEQSLRDLISAVVLRHLLAHEEDVWIALQFLG